jgi:glycosyltransferase involved in cell wall biosynthesis
MRGIMSKSLKSKDKRHLLSIIVSMYNEEESLDTFFAEIKKVMKKLSSYDYEIVCVDDGSTDKTYEMLEALAKEDDAIKVIKFSRNFGKEYGMMAGLRFCKGDAAIPMDVDLQDPPKLIVDFVKKWEEGYDMVYGIRNDRTSDTFAKRITAKLFYKTYNLMTRSPIPYNAGDYRLIDRKVIDAILSLKERNIFMKGVFGWTGFKSCGVKYVRQKRCAGTSKWNYWKLWNFALDGITASTTFPLRVWSYLGTILSGVGMLYALYIIIKTIIYGIDVPGYASLLVFILLLGGIQMIILGILGEYIGRIFIEVKNRPLYIVEKKVNIKDE